MKNRHLRMVWGGVALLILTFILVPTALADAPFAVAKVNDVTVVLHKEPCKLDAVTNVKQRATWQEKGKLTEGCWGVIPQLGVVIFYFADKTVAAMPIPIFEQITGT